MTAVCVPERVLLHLVAWILSPWLGVVWGLRLLPISLFDFHLFVGCPVGLVWCGESCPSGLAWCGEHKCWVNFFAGFLSFYQDLVAKKRPQIQKWNVHWFYRWGPLFCNHRVCPNVSLLNFVLRKWPPTQFLRIDPCEIDSFWFLKIVDPSWCFVLIAGLCTFS